MKLQATSGLAVGVSPSPYPSPKTPGREAGACPPLRRGPERERGAEGRVGALLASRLLTLGCVPIQASSGAHLWAAPPSRTGLGPGPLEPGVGSESLRSSMPPAQNAVVHREPRSARSRDQRA